MDDDLQGKKQLSGIAGKGQKWPFAVVRLSEDA